MRKIRGGISFFCLICRASALSSLAVNCSSLAYQCSCGIGGGASAPVLGKAAVLYSARPTRNVPSRFDSGILSLMSRFGQGDKSSGACVWRQFEVLAEMPATEKFRRRNSPLRVTAPKNKRAQPRRALFPNLKLTTQNSLLRLRPNRVSRAASLSAACPWP